jgi:hypothetical protein
MGQGGCEFVAAEMDFGAGRELWAGRESWTEMELAWIVTRVSKSREFLLLVEEKDFKEVRVTRQSIDASSPHESGGGGGGGSCVGTMNTS